MSYFIKVTEPENASGQLQNSYDMLQTTFLTVPKVFVAQSIRPDLLEPEEKEKEKMIELPILTS